MAIGHDRLLTGTPFSLGVHYFIYTFMDPEIYLNIFHLLFLLFMKLSVYNTKANHLKLFREARAVYCEDQMEHIKHSLGKLSARPVARTHMENLGVAVIGQLGQPFSVKIRTRYCKECLHTATIIAYVSDNITPFFSGSIQLTVKTLPGSRVNHLSKHSVFRYGVLLLKLNQ